MSDALGTREGGGQRRPFPSGPYWGLSPSCSLPLASHPLPNPNSSSPASRALSSITNITTHIESHGLIRPPQTPIPPRPGALSLVPGHSVLEDTLLGPGRQAWARPSTHLSVFALRVKPPGGLRLRRVSFFLYFVRFIYERIALGSGKGRCGPILPADAGGLGCPGSTFLVPVFEPRPRQGSASWEPQAPPLRGRPLP